MSIRAGIDVGGTFTDVALFDELSNTLQVYKLPSTPDDPGEAVANGLQHIRAGRDVRTLVHGTTVATNALLEVENAEVALLVTEGFRDVLQIARQERPRMYHFFDQRPEPLAPRRLRFEIRERMTHTGTPKLALDEEGTRRIAETLRTGGIRSVAVCFLHSYANSAHERRVREIFEEVAPELDITLSSDLVSEFKEYERMSTAVVNAFVRPTMRRYLLELARRLETQSAGRFEVMQSNGGMMSAAAASAKPVHTVLSGPAAGAIAGAELGRLAGFSDVLSVDMGGTSFDISVAGEGGLAFTTESEVAGQVIKVPMIDIHTLGAGGGSIASVDSGGGIQVGPRSAGAVPGPACYGFGGEEPTVTDANLVLGRLSPDGILGGDFRLDLDAARRAVHDRVAVPLDLSLDAAAEGIVRVVNAAMVKGMRYVSIERGLDPRDYALVAFGGGGPAHAAELGDDLGVRAVVVPPFPGIHSALGLLFADFRHDFARTLLCPVEEIIERGVQAVLDELEAEALSRLKEEGVAIEDVILSRTFDVRYVGQGFELPVSVPLGRVDASSVEGINSRFHAAHELAYGFRKPGEATEVVNVRVVGLGRVPQPSLVAAELDSPDASAAAIGERSVYLEGRRVLTTVYDRRRLHPGNAFEGPAIVEHVDTTTVVLQKHHARIDVYGNLILEAGGRS